MTPQISLVMPAYNEEACIGQTVPNQLDALERSGVTHELIVVDNGSSDRTGPILDELARARPRLRVVHLSPNRGYGGAITRGFAEAEGDVVGFNCADGEIDPQDVIVLYRVLSAGDLDICKAKRIDRQDGIVRALMSFGYHFLVGLTFRIHTTDINGYPVLIRRSALQRLSLVASNWMINVDILREARAAGLRMGEIDVQHRRRAGGRSHVRWYYPVLFTYQLFSYRRSVRRRAPGSAAAIEVVGTGRVN